MPRDLDPGSTIYFTLTIDGESLGYFNGCEGLSSTVEIEHRQEGGNNGFVWQFPSRVTFSNIRLTRAGSVWLCSALTLATTDCVMRSNMASDPNVRSSSSVWSCWRSRRSSVTVALHDAHLAT